MRAAVIKQSLIGVAYGKIISDMVDTGAKSTGETPDIADMVSFFDRQECLCGFRETTFSNVIKRNNHSALKKDGELLLNRV